MFDIGFILQMLILISICFLVKKIKDICVKKKVWYKSKKLRIHIEGNIAAGKSTLIRHLQKQFPEKVFIPEPVAKWEPTLNLVKKQPGCGYEFLLQVIVAEDYAVMKRRLSEEMRDCITERSVISCVEVFAAIYKDMGPKFLNDQQLKYLKEKQKSCSINYDACIYVAVPADQCYDRLLKRGRQCEDQIKVDYLKLIERKYAEMLDKLRFENQNVYTIDGTVAEDEVLTQAIQIIKSLE